MQTYKIISRNSYKAFLLLRWKCFINALCICTIRNINTMTIQEVYNT